MAEWHIGTLQKSEMVAASVKALTFSVKDWQKHKAGQHYDIRLTAPNGYQAERSYSAASSPEDEGIVEFGIQLLPDGEVSPYLFSMQPGQQIELRGPIGGHFIWELSQPSPLLLIGGGSGMVPLMSMVRHHMRNRARDAGREIVFLISARGQEHVLYAKELRRYAREDSGLRLAITLTDQQPLAWRGYKRRIDTMMIKNVFGEYVSRNPDVYICGPTRFVETAAHLLSDAGFPARAIRTERFGGA